MPSFCASLQEPDDVRWDEDQQEGDAKPNEDHLREQKTQEALQRICGARIRLAANQDLQTCIEHGLRKIEVLVAIGSDRYGGDAEVDLLAPHGVEQVADIGHFDKLGCRAQIGWQRRSTDRC